MADIAARRHQDERAVPKWIWDRGGETAREIVLSRSFETEKDGVEARLYLAVTGRVTVALNGAVIGELQEHPRHLASFTRFVGFPDRLAAGSHRLELRIVCSEPMPIVEVNVHLLERRVGCIGFLEGDGLWLPTDDSWRSGESPARVICLLGEEPYGDLENGPDWFVRGGYGDIGTRRLTGYEIAERFGAEADIGPDGLLSLSGSYASQPESLELPELGRGERHIFYHLRKQQEWAELRAFQRRSGIEGGPRVVAAMAAEYNMRFRIDNDGEEPATIVWNGAESSAELERYDGCITEAFTVEAGGSFTILPQGMRYVQLFPLGPSGKPFRLRVVFEEVGVLLERIGQFDSDCPAANRIYEVAAHTNLICHQTGLWDGVKRDRLNWTYDFFMAAKADYVLWNDMDVLKRTIRELGKTPDGYWMNSFPAYTCWWFVNIWDYYWHTGDSEFVREIKDDLNRHLRWTMASIDPATGFFAKRHQAFIEWVPMSEEDAWHTLHAVLAMALDSVRRLNAAIPGLDLPESPVPLPSIPASAFLDSPSIIALLLGAESGYVSEEQARAALIGYEASDPVTPLSAYWLAERLVALGRPELGWKAIERVWGRMLEEGATTFWEGVTLAPAEDYHRSLTTYTAYDSYRISLCHSWSSTPVQWMSRHLLGVEPAAPGSAKVYFRPNAVPGMNRCRGQVATPHGPIRVEWERREDGTLAASIDAPRGVEIIRAPEAEGIVVR
ncbi:alpha-L-rhamnosidase C-terminal domain-containing protein [Cohnella nanjingensis]|uniref:Alpha-L-rhamnosidase n=1 Tax=Cohnella nanjingensis TaxID=1387779 RepID=A0A7X0VEW6_9BACL|nr:alpha-L-rhamnosidase C-terminal domain-containing protein [Cohnella nanjingensis]MBB6669999.1 alpha-L-rhamnosidase [Cohnella nanjingensis]